MAYPRGRHLRQALHVARDGHGHIPVWDCQLLLHILWHIYEHWAGPPCPCKVEGLRREVRL